ncbi:hypothetical protein G6011_00878 [Alternaria panax]|uniref:Uncharacterized protein n=1 Tax=Alternaria panax TaxID=48097 RepID=A0AAD4NV41_9PLEO|nr:hypothetical protein G6011_00878 [Alternaria panax]
MPTARSRNPARLRAHAANEKARMTQDQQPDRPIQIRPQVAFNNPYLEIVGDGPYGQNQAMYTATGIADADAAAKVKKSYRRDFTPYFDAADVRNGTELGSPKKDGFRNPLTKKDVNQKVRQATLDTDRTTRTRRENTNAEKSSEPRPPPRVFSGAQPLPSLTPYKPTFTFPASPKTTKARTVPATRQWPGTLSSVVEAPSPLKASSKDHPTSLSKHKRTSTLDRILILRANEQAKALAQLEGEQHTPSRAFSCRVSDPESQRVANHTSRGEKRHASEFTAVKEGKNGFMMAGPSAPTKSASASSSVYSNDDTTPEDEMGKLSKAVVGLRPFQDLPAPLLDRSGFERMSAVPEGLNVRKIEAGKVEPAQQKPLAVAQAELLEYFNVPLETAGTGKAEQESSSQESLATASSEGYEKVGSKEKLGEEQNGGKRRWFKGFRKG